MEVGFTDLKKLRSRNRIKIVEEERSRNLKV